MEEIDIKTCLKKINKDEKNTKEIIVKLKNNHKKCLSFLFAWYKMEQKVLIFGEKYITINKFHICEKQLILIK